MLKALEQWFGKRKNIIGLDTATPDRRDRKDRRQEKKTKKGKMEECNDDKNYELMNRLTLKEQLKIKVERQENEEGLSRYTLILRKQKKIEKDQEKNG